MRILGLIFATLLIVNFIGLVTDSIPETTRLLLMCVGGIGLGVVSWRDRQQRGGL